MSTAMDAARSGMLQHERNIELIANNMANVNTVGYKRLAVHFQDLLSTEEALGVLFEGESVAPSMGVALDETTRILEPGAISANGDPLSMAITGDGFFQVRQGDGSVAYTRDGSFTRDAEGFIVTSGGLQLEPPIQLAGPLTELAIQPDGTISLRNEAGELETVGQIQLAMFQTPSALESVGENLLLASDDSGPAITVTPGEDGSGQILNGVLEMSNVDLALEMTNLIVAQRAYQFNLQAFQTANDMLKDLNDATQV